jgi:hypothetical protein
MRTGRMWGRQSTWLRHLGEFVPQASLENNFNMETNLSYLRRDLDFLMYLFFFYSQDHTINIAQGGLEQAYLKSCILFGPQLVPMPFLPGTLFLSNFELRTNIIRFPGSFLNSGQYTFFFIPHFLSPLNSLVSFQPIKCSALSYTVC